MSSVKVERTHDYGRNLRDKIPVSFSSNDDFDVVKGRIKKEFGVDDSEKALYTGIQVEESSYQLKLQTGETCQLTDGARIGVIFNSYDGKNVNAHLAPNHADWDSTRPAVVTVSGKVSAALNKK